jgi:uncharacterized repeat protein (TIGR03843 family)
VSEEERQARTRALSVLLNGEVAIEGRMPWSSNATLLVTLRCGADEMRAIYKPESGERPLWDYPHGLWRREVAAYAVSDALGWDIVPETVTRLDAPMGIGSLQRFVEDADFEQHYFTLYEDPQYHDRLRQMCVFDLVVNNADRKGGHCLVTEDGRIFGIDHGLTFQPSPRLRTVIWEFGGQPIPPAWRADLRRVAEAPLPELDDLLDEEEIEAFRRRALAVADLDRLPTVGEDYRHYPWPYV